MKDTSFHFSDKIVEEEFMACKKKITQMTNLAPFDPNLECILLTNASKLYGLAFILIQKKVITLLMMIRPTQEFSPSWDTRKRVQEKVEIS